MKLIRESSQDIRFPFRQQVRFAFGWCVDKRGTGMRVGKNIINNVSFTLRRMSIKRRSHKTLCSLIYFFVACRERC